MVNASVASPPPAIAARYLAAAARARTRAGFARSISRFRNATYPAPAASHGAPRTNTTHPAAGTVAGSSADPNDSMSWMSSTPTVTRFPASSGSGARVSPAGSGLTMIGIGGVDTVLNEPLPSVSK